MRLITPSELTQYSENELSALFREVSQRAACTAPSSPERRNALRTLENVRRERAARRAPRLPQP